MGALNKVGVLVTRPVHQSEHLCDLIRAEGGQAIAFPVLEIVDPEDLSPFHDLIERLDEFDIAVFISPNAVAKALNGILARRTLPAHLRLAAVGKGSARELERMGFHASICPTGRFNSEALLELPAMQDVAGKRIVIFRGEGGRELIAETLAARGAQVEYAEVYRRMQPKTDTGDLLRHWARGEIQMAVITSNEALRNLFDMVGKLGQRWLRGTQLVVLSERAAALARDLGFEHPARVAREASDEAILSALRDSVPG